MSEKVLFILGAGASQKAVPTVAKFPEALLNLEHTVFKNRIIAGERRDITYKDLLPAPFFEDCKWLAENSQTHSTIDTFAKKLYLTKDFHSLKRLKATLSIFLLIQQISTETDIRYDVFFTTLAKLKPEGIKLPEDLHIATWNYDNQIMRSLLRLQSAANVEDIFQLVQIMPWHKYEGFKVPAPTFHSVNGMAGFIDSKGGKTNDFYHLITANFTEDIAGQFRTICDDVHEKGYAPEFLINFAWEQSDLVRSTRESLLALLPQITTMVVIGYSFPTFNRNYDKSIFQSSASLKKVYIQNTPEAIQGVENRLKSLSHKKLQIIRITDTDQFYIPIELDV